VWGWGGTEPLGESFPFRSLNSGTRVGKKLPRRTRKPMQENSSPAKGRCSLPSKPWGGLNKVSRWPKKKVGREKKLIRGITIRRGTDVFHVVGKTLLRRGRGESGNQNKKKICEVATGSPGCSPFGRG